MLNPPVTEIVKKEQFENKYILISATAQRARQIREGAPILTEVNSNKEVTIAAYEIYEDKISYIRNQQ